MKMKEALVCFFKKKKKKKERKKESERERERERKRKRVDKTDPVKFLSHLS